MSSCADLQTTEQDAKRELHLALSSIKHVYESLDWKQSLQLEQASKAKKTTNTLQPLGMVFLTSLRHCPFVSILAPLAATVGAGAATIALPKEGFENVNRILRRLVRENLDVEAVGIGEGLFFDAFLNMEFDVAVLQDAKTFGNACAQLTKSNPFIRIVRPSFGSPAIFIDRTVEDIEGAASCIVHALRWASKNGNPLVPRLCFVDEYVIEELKCAIQKRANLEGGGSARKEPAKSHAKGDGVSPRETESGELVSLLYTGLDIPILFSSTQE
jgi:acyl-CoA reductase-like NAD-dependent aldehyde dehydrogenase